MVTVVTCAPRKSINSKHTTREKYLHPKKKLIFISQKRWMAMTQTKVVNPAERMRGAGDKMDTKLSDRILSPFFLVERFKEEVFLRSSKKM